MMRYPITLHQLSNGTVVLSLLSHFCELTENLSPDQANQLAYALMRFAASQQDTPFTLQPESLDTTK